MNYIVDKKKKKNRGNYWTFIKSLVEPGDPEISFFESVNILVVFVA